MQEDGTTIMPFNITSAEEETLEEPLLTETQANSTNNNTSNDSTSSEHSISDNDSISDNRRGSSLASAPTTPCLAVILVPLLALATHALFLYGQRMPMWRLTQKQHVDVWFNASTFESRQFFDTLGLHHGQHFAVDEDKDVKTFTYTYAMQELWRARRMPGKFFPRLAAVLLALFSGVWPHLKLLLLNLTWCFTKHPVRRTRTLRWLSTLGKWSLADVLVVCVMVGVLNLDWDVDPEQIRQGLSDELPIVIGIISTLYTPQDLCKEFLHYSCKSPSKLNHKLRCSACLSGIHAAFDHPSWAGGTGNQVLDGMETSGGGSVQLRVEGMKGIYAFCLAVILSICLSLAVDVFDSRARRASEAEVDSTQASDETNLLMAGSTENGLVPNGPDQGSAPLALENGTGLGDASAPHNPDQSLQLDYGIGDEDRLAVFVQAVEDRNSRVSYFSWTRVALTILAVVVLIIVVCAAALPTMERRVDGALPHLLHDILGVVWTRPYSLSSLVRTTGDARGWDLLLMATFSLFVVFGPILRASLCVFVLVVRVPKRLQGKIRNLIVFIGAFCASEVFVVAVFMVDLLMPAITGTIINMPQCAEIYPGSTCLEVQFVLLWKTFGLLLIGGTSLVLVANLVIRFGFDKRDDARRRRRPVVDMSC
jgi:uncharacterized paraquat-inducible protein A